jgi:hypothetical protein
MLRKKFSEKKCRVLSSDIEKGTGVAPCKFQRSSGWVQSALVLPCWWRQHNSESVRYRARQRNQRSRRHIKKLKTKEIM